MVRRAIFFALCFALPAAAQEDEAEARARTLFEQGFEAGQRGHWEEAADLFRRSREVLDRPSTMYNLALALSHTGESRAAVETLDEYFAAARPDDARMEDARTLRERLEPRIARLRLTVVPADANVEVDGRATSSREIVLDPGPHTIVVAADGYARETVELVAASGDRIDRAVELAVGSGSSGGGEDPTPFVLIGAGAAVAVGGLALLIAGHVDFAAVMNAEPRADWGAYRDAWDRAPILTGIGWPLFGVGAALALVGVVLSMGGSSSSDTALLIGPTRVALATRY